MRSILIACGLVLGVGCGKGDKLEGFTKDVDGYRAKMCACTSEDCAEGVFEAYKKWENDTLEPAMKGKKPSDFPAESVKKYEETERAMKDCRRKLRTPTGG